MYLYICMTGSRKLSQTSNKKSHIILHVYFLGLLILGLIQHDECQRPNIVFVKCMWFDFFGLSLQRCRLPYFAQSGMNPQGGTRIFWHSLSGKATKELWWRYGERLRFLFNVDTMCLKLTCLTVHLTRTKGYSSSVTGCNSKVEEEKKVRLGLSFSLMFPAARYWYRNIISWLIPAPRLSHKYAEI